MDKAFLDEHLRLETEDPVMEDFVKLAERYIKEADQSASRQRMTAAHWIGSLVPVSAALLAALVALSGHHWQ